MRPRWTTQVPREAEKYDVLKHMPMSAMKIVFTTRFARSKPGWDTGASLSLRRVSLAMKCVKEKVSTLRELRER